MASSSCAVSASRKAMKGVAVNVEEQRKVDDAESKPNAHEKNGGRSQWRKGGEGGQCDEDRLPQFGPVFNPIREGCCGE